MLATVLRLKRQLMIPPEDISQDDELTAFIMAASSAIELYCKREFELKERIETYNGSGASRLFLRCSPVTNVASCRIEDKPVEGFSLIHDTGILQRAEGWPRGQYNIQVTYFGGYILPSDAEGAMASTLPASLEHACLILAKSMYGDDLGKESERIGDYSVRYVVSAGGEAKLPPVVRALVEPFVRRWIS